MRAYEAVVEALTDIGGDVVFGLMGDANLRIIERYASRPNTTYVSAAHEAGVVSMAHGYALASGRLGIGTVTHGPALTNTLTGLVEAAKSRTPLLLIAGDTAAAAIHHHQNVDQSAAVAPTGALFMSLTSPERAYEVVVRAATIAVAERRPVVLNLPHDIQDGRADDIERVDRVVRAPAGPADDGAIAVAAEAIANARRPLVLCGRGAIDSEARLAALALANRLGAPVATTLKGKSLFHGEPEDMGIFGGLAEPAHVEAMASADCIIALGASLNPWTTQNGDLIRNATVVHVDDDRSAHGRYQRGDVDVLGDAAATARAIVDLLDRSEHPTPPTWWNRPVRVQHTSPRPADGRPLVGIRHALHVLDAAVPADRILVTDGGRFVPESWTEVSAPEPASFLFTVNFGSIGLGMAHAVGAAFADRSRPVLLVIGDGGFMHGGLAEFNSAVRHGIDLIVAVCNDGGYGAEHIQFRRRNADPSLALFDWPDFAPLAAALGGSGHTIDSEESLGRLAQVVADRRGPLLLDLRLDPDEVPSDRH